MLVQLPETSNVDDHKVYGDEEIKHQVTIHAEHTQEGDDTIEDTVVGQVYEYAGIDQGQVDQYHQHHHCPGTRSGEPNASIELVSETRNQLATVQKDIAVVDQIIGKEGESGNDYDLAGDGTKVVDNVGSLVVIAAQSIVENVEAIEEGHPQIPHHRSEACQCHQQGVTPSPQATDQEGRVQVKTGEAKQKSI